MMNRGKVIFGVVSKKPIESTDCEIDECEPIKTPKRERSFSSMPYHDVLKLEMLKSPIRKYFFHS